CDKTNAASADARGAIVGNLVYWAGACALMIVVVAVYSRFGHVSLARSVEALGAPSQLLPLAIVTVPSTVSGTFYLLSEVQCAVDGVIAVIGVLMCACPVAVLCWVAYMAPRRLVRMELQQTSSRLSGTACMLLHKHVTVLLHRRVRWLEANTKRSDGVEVCREKRRGGTLIKAVEDEESGFPRAQRTPHPSWCRLATVILIDYALVWYACVDVAVLTMAALLSGVSSLGSGSACRASAIVVLVLYWGQLVLCAVVRPFTTLFSHIFALLTLTLSTLAVAFQVWYLFGSVVDGVDLSALYRLLTAAAVCDITVSGVSIVKSLFDVFDVLRACRRHIKVMFPMLFVHVSFLSEPMNPNPLERTIWKDDIDSVISAIEGTPPALPNCSV
ncbi:membrane-associated protein, putative, partial [Bodo saltans]